MKEPRVKEILDSYKNGNIIGVQEYLNQKDMIVDPSTWAGNVQKLIDNKQYESAKQIIELVAYKIIKIQ